MAYMKKMRKTKMRSKKNARKTKRIRGGAARERSRSRERTQNMPQEGSMEQKRIARNKERQREMENSKVPEVDVVEKIENLHNKLNRNLDPLTELPVYKKENSNNGFLFNNKRTIFKNLLRDNGCFLHDRGIWSDDESSTAKNMKYINLKEKYNRLTSMPNFKMNEEYNEIRSNYEKSLENLNDELKKKYGDTSKTLYQYLMS